LARERERANVKLRRDVAIGFLDAVERDVGLRHRRVEDLVGMEFAERPAGLRVEDREGPRGFLIEEELIRIDESGLVAVTVREDQALVVIAARLVPHERARAVIQS